jgi:hypothetical protein
MKSQERRDDEAVTIVTGLLLFLLVAVGGAVVLVLANQFLPFSGDLLNDLTYAAVACAVVASSRYLYRHRGR